MGNHMSRILGIEIFFFRLNNDNFSGEPFWFIFLNSGGNIDHIRLVQIYELWNSRL